MARTLLMGATVNRRRRTAMLLGLTLVASAIGAYAVARPTTRAPAARAEADGARAEPARVTTTTAAEGSPVRARLLAAAVAVDAGAAPAAADDAGGDDAVAALRRGLASDDEAVRIAAVEAAVASTAVDTLPELEKFDLKSDPETAPTVIYGVALLGASADGAERDRAAGTLGRWLRDEQKREGPDVAGNVSNLVEALGDAGGSNAVDALDAVLDEDTLPLHVQTLAVQKLGELADPRSRGSVERFATRVAALPAAEGLDEELRVEAVEAARVTLSKI